MTARRKRKADHVEIIDRPSIARPAKPTGIVRMDGVGRLGAAEPVTCIYPWANSRGCAAAGLSLRKMKD